MIRISIDARSLEGYRTGVGRTLFNVLREWSGKETFGELRRKNVEILLYLKNEIPPDVEALPFKKKILKPILKDSNFLFQHLLLPLALRRDRPDAFFGPAYLLPCWGLGGIYSVVLTHDVSFAAHPEWESPSSRFFLGFFARRSALKAEKIITVSRFSKEEIKQLWRISGDKIVVAPLAADSSFFPATEEMKRKIRGKYNLGDNYVIFVGSFFTRRHIPELIDGFEKATRDSEKKFQLVLVGRNHTRPFRDINGLAVAINKKNGYETIKILSDFIPDDLPALYSASRAAVYFSDYEGFGLPLLEAMKCGTPVITSNVSSLPEVGGEAAVYAASNASPDISAALKMILTDDKKRQDLIQLGYKQAGKFSWNKTARIILETLVDKS